MLFFESLTNYLAVTGYWPGKSSYGESSTETNVVYKNWFQNSLQINIPYIIFQDPESSNLMMKSRNESELSSYFILKDLHNFFTYKNFPYLPHTSIIWNEKINLVLEAHHLFPNVEWLVWIDAGVNTFRHVLPPPIVWPQVNLSLIYKPSFIYTQRAKPHGNMICGNSFIIHRDVLPILHELYYKALSTCIETNNRQNACIDDQVHFMTIANQRPDLSVNLSEECKSKNRGLLDCNSWDLILMHFYGWYKGNDSPWAWEVDGIVRDHSLPNTIISSNLAINVEGAENNVSEDENLPADRPETSDTNPIVQQLLKIKQEVETAFPLPTTKDFNVDADNYLGHTTPQNCYKTRSKWYELIGDTPVLVHNFWGRWHQFGNYFGIYMESVACASISGTHYLAVNLDWEDNRDAQVDDIPMDQMMDFFNMLPLMIINDHPAANRDEARNNVVQNCPCSLFCWMKSESAWIKRADYIGSILFNALDKYTNKYESKFVMIINKTCDFSSVSDSKLKLLPLVPDVTIHFRCSDNLRHSRYGFLPFKAYFSLIPENVSTIYVTSDHPSRSLILGGSVYDGDNCGLILFRLFKFLTEHYPRADVVIKRGDDIFRTLARLTFSKYVVCAPSTFCLWPGLATNGTVFFPVSTVVLEGRSPFIRDNFKWIRDFDTLHFHDGDTIETIVEKLGS